MKNYDIIVIGAGAAGLIAAGRAAESGSNVLLVEKMKQEGRKLLITGKGRCNITNHSPIADFIKHVHPNGRFLKHAFSQFFANDIVQLLTQQGVETFVERGNRVFPVSDKAADVLQALLRWNRKNGVDILRKCNVQRLLVSDGKITGIEAVVDDKKKQFHAQNIILCTGGSSYPATGSTGDGYKLAKAVGHNIEPVRPALVPLETSGDIAQRLMGLSLKNAKAIVWSNGKKLKEDFGELLFTHWGLSGPIILTISRLVVDELHKKNNVEISIDLKPALDEQKLDNRLLRDLDDNGKKRVENIFKLWLPSTLIPVFMELTGIDQSKEGHQLTGKERRKIRLLMKDFRFTITGHRPFEEAIITAGGISTKEINSKTMESKLVENLYFAGEVIDLDADTGGYNLQIAYSTGWLAAQSCMQHKNQS